MIKSCIYMFTALASVLLMSGAPVSASHSWGSYHWASTSSPFTLKLGDNLTSNWDSYLATTSTDWSVSSVLDTAIVSGNTIAKRCKPTLGQVEVCNSSYGKNGWLGIAQVYVSGNHITQGTVKMNDSYFNTAAYNNPAWKNLVLCQEVGHTLGLDHQDENFDNTPLGSCMDYSNNPVPNQSPNQHDYDQLELIYGHIDATNTVSSTPNGVSQLVQAGAPGDWGKQVRSQGKTAVFEKHLANGQKIFTFVIYA